MLKMSLAFAALLSAGFTLAACGESDVEKAELVTCREVVKLALNSPGSFKVTKSNFDETSEGEAVILDVDYVDASGASQHVREKCWFGGYGENKPLKELYVEKNNEFIAVPETELEAYKKKLAG